jgi:hypothetical protein
MPVGLCVRAANVRDEVGPDFCALSEARLPAMLRYRVPYGVLNTISLVNPNGLSFPPRVQVRNARNITGP